MKVEAICVLAALLLAATGRGETAAELGERYWRTKSEADRLAWVSALDREGHDFRTESLKLIDPLIGTEGSGSEYGGMMPYTGVPFGSFHMVPMTRLNRVGQLNFNQADDTLLGFILTRQPAIWMGDWGEVRIPIEPRKIEKLEATPYRTRLVAGGRTYEYTATAHAAWLRGRELADWRVRHADLVKGGELVFEMAD